jgi:hypothetical protein
MKKFKYVLTGFVLLFALFAFMNHQREEMLAIGAALPGDDIELLNVDNKEVTLADIAKENGLLVIFSCNTCPFVVGNGDKSEGWEKRYPEIGELCEKLDVGMVLVNSNEAKRNGDDSFAEMQAHYKEMNYNCYYVVDENSVLADLFGALTTPHVYLFDSEFKLVYRGAIDDNVNKKKDVKEKYLNDALNNMVNGKEIKPKTTKQLGCSIKRV